MLHSCRQRRPTVSHVDTQCNTHCNTHCITHYNTHCNTHCNTSTSMRRECRREATTQRRPTVSRMSMSPFTRDRVMSHMTQWALLLRLIHVTYVSEPCHIWVTHAKHVNESCHVVNESCQTDVDHVNESCHSHVKHVNESCRISAQGAQGRHRRPTSLARGVYNSWPHIHEDNVI